MNQSGRFSGQWLFTAILLAWVGCGREPSKPESKGPPDKDQPSFKEGKGLFLPEETRRSIGLQIAEVTERKLQRRVTAEVQVYEAENGGICRASGLVSQEQAAGLHPGQPVSLIAKDGKTVEGTLERIDGQALSGSRQAELIVELPAAATQTGIGTSFTASIKTTNEESAIALPASALLRAAQGDFVYVVNGERLLRTTVHVGDEGDGFVQIKDGLYAGNKVAVAPVQILWLTELRLSRASGDSD